MPRLDHSHKSRQALLCAVWMKTGTTPNSSDRSPHYGIIGILCTILKSCVVRIGPRRQEDSPDDELPKYRLEIVWRHYVEQQSDFVLFHLSGIIRAD